MRTWLGAWAFATLAALAFSGVVVVGASAHAPHAAAPNVLSVYLTPANITEQSSFSVYLQLADSSNVQQVYFTFCQLTSPLCYLPIVMAPQSGNWYLGTTHAMTGYPGMNVGVKAGINITIVTTNNQNITEPSIPNQFGNLTIAQTVTNEYVYEMVVADHVYDLSGTVVNAATGAALSGATVTITPGVGRTTTTDSTGRYTLAGLLNGTYSIAVSDGSYSAANISVVIAGQSLVKDLAVGSATGPNQSSSVGLAGFFATPLGLAIIGIAVVAACIVAYRALTRGHSKKRGPAGAPGTATGSTSDTGPKPE